ncbi:MAG: hypothetical protein L3K14_07730 [Thermoplasmata archaeon]|nr:hypothetical protein [Thermoplasmata archaeon]
MARKGPAIASALLVLSTAWVAFVLATAPSSGTSTSASYLIPRSQFNITDHNLSFATNMILLSPSVNGSFSLTVSDRLVASPAYAAGTEELELGIGPGPNPAGGDETYITPLFILQAAATGFLRLQYIPFAMNDTLGFVVYSGTPEPSGPSPFADHVIELRFVQTSALVPPYQPTLPYGQTNGNVTLRLDGQILAGPYPVDWATVSAFYGYGLATGRFIGGAVYANVTQAGSLSTPDTLDGLPLVVLEGAFGLATLAGAAGLIGVSWYLRRD